MGRAGLAHILSVWVAHDIFRGLVASPVTTNEDRAVVRHEGG